MKIHPNFAQLACAVLMLVLYCLLPVVSFVVVVPLLHINGIVFATMLNAIMFLPIILSILLIFFSLFNQRKLSLIVSILSIIGIIVIGILIKAIIVNGNLKWLKGSTTLLMNALNNADSASGIMDISQSIDWIASNFLVLGLGYYAYVLLTVVFAILVAVTSENTDTPPVNLKQNMVQPANSEPVIKKDNNASTGAF